MPAVWNLNATPGWAQGLQNASTTLANAEKLQQQREAHQMELARAAEDLEQRKFQRKVAQVEWQRELKERTGNREMALAMIRDSARQVTEPTGKALDAMGQVGPALSQALNRGLRALQQQDPSSFLPPELRAHSRTLQRLLKEGNLSPEAQAFAVKQYQDRANAFMDQKRRDMVSSRLSRSITSGDFGEDEQAIQGVRGLQEMLAAGAPVDEVVKHEFALRSNIAKDRKEFRKKQRTLDWMELQLQQADASGINIDAAEEYAANISAGVFDIDNDSRREFEDLLKGAKAAKVVIPGTDLEIQDTTGLSRGGFVGDMSAAQRADLELQARRVVMEETSKIGLGLDFEEFEEEVAKRIHTLQRAYGWKPDPLVPDPIESDEPFVPTPGPAPRSGRGQAPAGPVEQQAPERPDMAGPRGEFGMRELETSSYKRARSAAGKSGELLERYQAGKLTKEDVAKLSPAERRALIAAAKKAAKAKSDAQRAEMSKMIGNN